MNGRAQLRAQALSARATGQAITVGPELLLELLDDQVAVELADLRRRAALVRESMPLPSATVVHVLAGGNALCGKPGHELDGSTGHSWVSRGDAIGCKIISCQECRKAFGVATMLEGRR